MKEKHESHRFNSSSCNYIFNLYIIFNAFHLSECNFCHIGWLIKRDQKVRFFEKFSVSRRKVVFHARLLRERNDDLLLLVPGFTLIAFLIAAVVAVNHAVTQLAFIQASAVAAPELVRFGAEAFCKKADKPSPSTDEA